MLDDLVPFGELTWRLKSTTEIAGYHGFPFKIWFKSVPWLFTAWYTRATRDQGGWFFTSTGGR